MRITYDEEADALWIELITPRPGGYAEDLEDGVMIHRDKKGRVVALEVLDATERLGENPLGCLTVERFAAEGKASLSG